MLKITSSRATERNSLIQELSRDGMNNTAWLKKALTAMPGKSRAKSTAEAVHVILLGGKNQTAFRLRIAQAHARHDLLPSYWSHVALLDPDSGGDRIFEISLEPPAGFSFPTPENALQEGKTSAYESPRSFPNIALLRVPVSVTRVRTALRDYKYQRTVLDGPDLLLRWLAFAWGVGSAGNPLLEGFGVPSSAMLEVVLGAAGWDLTPGLESRSSCPEAIWQAALWWHTYYNKVHRQSIAGVYTAPHALQ